MNSHGLSRRARAVIDLDAIHDNLLELKAQAPNSRMIAVVKADAYGHGVKQVTERLRNEVDAFAVSSFGEAISLREFGIEEKIIILTGFVDADELKAIHHYNLDPVVHQAQQIDLLEAFDGEIAVDCWMKIDSGMGRLGFRPDQAPEAAARLSAIPGVGTVRMMSHLASADVEGSHYTDQQVDCINGLGLDNYEWSIANSAGLLAWPDTRRNWVRTGLALYGIEPLPGQSATLKPAMTMKSVVLAVNRRDQGAKIGYANTYTCDHDTPLAVVAAGYADGYPVHKNATVQVLIHNRLCDVVGRVSMDMITVDITGLDDVSIGDEVILFGDSPRVSDLAGSSGTIAYEILCNVGGHLYREYQNG